jgi:uncharacterized protein (TIGR03000 family)
MRCFLSGLLLALGASGAFAQNPIGASAGVGSFGGGFRPPFPGAMPQVMRPLPIGYPLYPYGSSFYGGFGGGFITSSNYAPYFIVPGPSYYFDAASSFAYPPAPPPYFVRLSGQLPATLDIEFPAPAKVWLNDKELSGKPSLTRSLTSAVLRSEQQYTFHIRARWEAKGKTFDYTRDITLGPGDHSKILVVNGTAVNEK